jgi:AcrR family transcriptional regulator
MSAHRSDSRRSARSERRRDQTRAEILDAARDVVLRDGLAAFSLAAVADELALTKPALYYYFDSRQALLFDLVHRELVEVACEVEAAVETTDGGADAVEQLMRTVFERYRDQLDLFLLVTQPPPRGELEVLVGPEELARIHPLNEQLYGGAEARLRADQRRGRFPRDRDPRRFAFTAHLAAIGLLTMKALTASSSDPLMHGDDELIGDLCRTFRDAAFRGGTR